MYVHHQYSICDKNKTACCYTARQYFYHDSTPYVYLYCKNFNELKNNNKTTQAFSVMRYKMIYY